MTFKNLDQLYRSSPDSYLALLKFIQLEFEKAQAALALSIEKGDSATFSHLKHKLFSTLNTLEYIELMSFLTKVTEDFELTQRPDAEVSTPRLNKLFYKLLQRLEVKVAEIEGLKVM